MIDTGLAGDVTAAWAELRPVVEKLFDALWQKPELPAMERHAAATLAGWLQERGFAVEHGVGGVATAFLARRGRGQPRVYLLAEYDALPGIDNDAVAARRHRGLHAGHGCAHNQIGPANCAAAIAAAEVAARHRLAGEVVVLGCPAEEIVWGKIALLRRGAFDGADAILTSHGDYQNGAVSRPCQSVVGGELVFTGESGHGGRTVRRNALDAAELAVQSIERLRAHHFPDTHVEHILRSAGAIPNVTPDEARLWINSRQLEWERARDVYDLVVDIAAHAARMAGAGFRHQPIAGTRGYLPNDVLGKLLQTCLEHVGPPRWTDAGVAWMRELVAVVAPGSAFSLDTGLALYTQGHDPFGQDDGEASWRIPLGRVNWAWPTQVPVHNWALCALAGHQASWPGPLMASEALALAVVELLRRPGLVQAAQDELARRVDGADLPPPPLGAWHTLNEEPERFWDGTWNEQ